MIAAVYGICVEWAPQPDCGRRRPRWTLPALVPGADHVDTVALVPCGATTFVLPEREECSVLESDPAVELERASVSRPKPGF